MIKQGGSTFTSEEALKRFFDRLTARESVPPVTTQGQPVKSTKGHQRATRELDALGF